MGKGYSPEQIVKKLREAEGKLASGQSVAEVSREFGVSETTFHRWKARYGSMNTSEASGEALSSVTERDARGFFAHCGYGVPPVRSI